MKKSTPISIAIIACICFALWFLVWRWDIWISKSDEALSIRQSGYTFINPLLECETKAIGSNQKYIPFEKDLINKIEAIQENNPNIHLSVYFRNLQNGPWFGINEDADFSPASLMKLPVLLMYLKWAEENPSILDKTITVTGENTFDQIYPPETSIVSWSGYSIKELLFHLIVYSDNLASANLLENIPIERQDRVFNELNIPLPQNMDYALSVKEYASFFRMLYNASYLTREYSEIALSILSHSRFKWGLTGKLPTNLPVAHKFWEREMLDGSGNLMNQLHDCGIVYYKPYPYLVCIMSRGNVEMPVLSQIIQDTSLTIYNEVSGKYPQ